MITFDYGSENLLSILGAFYDITGAIILARGLTFVRAAAILRQGQTGTWQFNPRMIRIFCEQRVDAWFGLALLLLGFSIQGAAGYGYKTTSWALFAAASILMAIIAAVYFLVREALTRRAYTRACRTFMTSDGRRLTEDQIAGTWDMTVDTREV